MDHNEEVGRYVIEESVLFENNRGFARGRNVDAVQQYATWQFTEDENGKRGYYWGHYATSAETAAKDYAARVTEYQKDHGVAEKSLYKYYSTQRPVDIGTFPKTDNGPHRIVNFESRENVEQSTFRAWGYLVYSAPLTEKQRDDYELRPSRSNPDIWRRMDDQAQIVGQWEDDKSIPDAKRLTWYYSDFGSYVAKEFVTPDQLAERHGRIMEVRARTAEKKPIAERLAEGAEQAARDNAARPAPALDKGKEDRT